MADYNTILVLLTIVLSTATTTHCRWIGGDPLPAKVGEYLALGDDLMDIPSPVSEPGPGGDFDIKEPDYAAPGPGDKLKLKEKETSEDTFIVQGKVYCDPCRIQIPTKISFALAGTKIMLVCHKAGSDEETYRVEGECDMKGMYKLNVVGDHAEEICEIIVSQSPDPNCGELMDDENHVRVSLTNKHGIKGKGRYVNPLGFMTTDADPRCKEALDELGFTGI